MLIGLSEDKTAIDIWVTMSKFKVTMVTFVQNNKMVSAHYIEDCLYHRGLKFHMLIGQGGHMTSIDFWFARSKSLGSFM